MLDLMRQRVFQITAGYEDQDDSDTLRSDPIFKMLLGRLPETGADLASQPTMSRFENGIRRQELDQLAEVFLEDFIGSYAEAPAVIVLDFDDTADLAHGEQEQARFNTHVGNTCFMPLHVYEGLSGRLIMTMLKPSLLKGPTSYCSTLDGSASRGLASDRDHLPGRQPFHLSRSDGLPRVRTPDALCDRVGHQ